MKVVLFCGGQGTRIREGADGGIPKPMIPVGYRPILWHIMRYYSYFGHRDFVLCLGYRGDAIKSYFRTYDESVSNDFTLSLGGRRVELLHTDIHDWRITFVDTGLSSNIGERLLAVRSHLKDDEVFLANYADGVSDLDLNRFLETFNASGKTGAFVAVAPSGSFHVVQTREDGVVLGVRHVGQSDVRINGGFFAFHRRIFDYIRPGEDLVAEPFQRLIEAGDLIAYRHHGFWACMDTFKEKQVLDDLCATGRAPWELWKRDAASSS